jgi:subtilisin family serine protease
VKIGVIDQGLGVGSAGLAGSDAGGSSGSDTPLQLLYSDAGFSYGQLPGEFSALEMGGAQVIVLPFGWTREGVMCADAGAPPALDAATFASVTEALRRAIAAHPSVLFIASAGNCGADAAGHTPGGMTSAPANLLTVGATDSAGNAAGFSNTGASVDLAAPGVAVPGPIETGTSASAAMAAGVAGLYLSVRGNLDAQGVAALARALKLSRVSAGTGLPGVPRLDALAVLAAAVAAR